MNRRKKLSIRGKVILMSLSIVLFTTITISIHVYKKSSDMIYQSTVEGIENKIDLVNERVNFLTEGIQQMTDEILDSGYLKEKMTQEDEKKIYHYFGQLTKRYTQIVNLYFTRKDKMYLYPRNKEYENDKPGQNPWYIMREKGQKQSGWTDVSIDGLTGKHIITYYKEVLVDGKRIGYIDVDISLADLLEFINKTKIGEEGKLYITNNKGVIAISPIEELIGKDIPDEELRTFIVKNSSGTLKYDSFDGSKFITFKTLKGSIQWKIFGVLPKTEVYKNCYELLKYILLCAILVATSSIFISVKVANKIVKDINKINQNLVRLGEGNLTKCSEMNSSQEISQTREIYNDAMKKIGCLICNVKKSYVKMTKEFYEMVQGAKETAKAVDMITESIQQIADHVNEQAFIAELKNLNHEIKKLETYNIDTEQMKQEIEQRMETLVKRMGEDTVALQVIAVASQHQLVIVQQLQERLVLLTVYVSSIEEELDQFKIDE